MPVLFPGPVVERIERGEITLAFRRWKRPTVVAGGALHSPAGLLAIEEVTIVTEADITEADARDAGYDTVDQVIASLQHGDDRTLYRIRFRRAGDDPRHALRADADLDDVQIAAIDAQLDRWDAASKTGPWTADVLRLIAARPAESSADLVADRPEERHVFKRRVRHLKKLGLTESLDVGYRLSPRGQAYLEHADRH